MVTRHRCRGEDEKKNKTTQDENKTKTRKKNNEWTTVKNANSLCSSGPPNRSLG